MKKEQKRLTHGFCLRLKSSLELSKKVFEEYNKYCETIKNEKNLEKKKSLH
ncbi:MAG TPA: hypothetical protein GX690_00545 [Tenericutes bacterium]|nr:hypothetical protein [Mycoplasmatota bacterium]